MRSAIRLGAVVVCGLVLVVGGCASTSTSPTTLEQRLFAVQGDFNTALRTIRTYQARPPCSATVLAGCKDAEVNAKLKEFARNGHRALTTAHGARTKSSIEIANLAVAELMTYLTERALR